MQNGQFQARLCFRVALLHQQGRGHRAVHAAAEGQQDAGTGRDRLARDSQHGVREAADEDFLLKG